MLFKIIVALFLLAVAFLLLKSSNKKKKKHRYSKLVEKHIATKKGKQRNSSSSEVKPPAINQDFVQGSTGSAKGRVNGSVFSDLKKEIPTIHSDVPEDFLAFEVLTSEKLDSKQKEIVSEISQAFKKPHPLLLPLTQRTFEPNELFELIKNDTEMTAKILHAVNSPLFGLEKPITNVNHAIIFMGVGKVKSIALQCAMQEGMTFTDKNQNEAYNKLWKASYLASSFCTLFAKELGESNPAELATHCLLSYLGDLAILSYKPTLAGFYLDDFTLFERTKIFQELLGTNAAVVGKFLAKQWQLPGSIESGIEHSILPLMDNMVSSKLSDANLRQLLLCYLSNRLGDLVAFGGLSDVPEIEEVSYEALGEVEFYYTQNNIQNSGFEKMNAVIRDPRFRKKLNLIISKLG